MNLDEEIYVVVKAWNGTAVIEKGTLVAMDGDEVVYEDDTEGKYKRAKLMNTKTTLEEAERRLMEITKEGGV